MGMHIGVTKSCCYVYGTTTLGATADHYEKQHSSTRNWSEWTFWSELCSRVTHTPL